MWDLFIHDGFNYTALGKVMYFPIGPKSFREWAEPCVHCEKRSRRIKQNCEGKCVKYCEPCFDKFQPTFCQFCDTPIETMNIKESRMKTIGEQAFRRVTTNVVFSLQKMRAGRIFEDSMWFNVIKCDLDTLNYYIGDKYNKCQRRQRHRRDGAHEPSHLRAPAPRASRRTRKPGQGRRLQGGHLLRL